MQIKISNKQKRRWPIYVAVGLLATASLGGISFYLLKEDGNKKTTYSIVSHNVAHIQNNPIEYTSTLHLLATTGEKVDTQLQAAAQKLLEIDRNNATKEVDNKTAILVDQLSRVLKLFYDCNDQSYREKDIKKAITNFFRSFSRHSTKEKYTLELHNKSFSSFDKAMRERKLIRFSPLCYSSAMVAFFTENSTSFDVMAFTEYWIASMKPHIKAICAADQSRKMEDLQNHYLLTFLFDMHITRRIIEDGGANAWVYLTTKLQKSPLGEPLQRIQKLLTLHTTQQPDIICLQEADKELVRVYLQKGYFVPKNAAMQGSVILYKSSVFGNSSVNVLTLTPLDIERHQTSGLSERNRNKLISKKSNEVSIHQLVYKQMIWLVVSAHACSSGDNTITLLKALLARKEKIESEEQKQVFLILCMDGNTSSDPNIIAKGLKTDLKEVLTLLETTKGNITMVKQKGKDINTVNKERSSFQVQLNKRHVPISSISDFIIFSHHVQAKKELLTATVTKTYLSSHGPNLHDNPSDHRALAVTFTLKPTKKTPL